MYTQIWNKYLPVIRILLKRSGTTEQFFQLNVSDFEKPGQVRKTGYKFNLHFNKGRADNLIHSSAIAKDLAHILLEDEGVKGLLVQNDYDISMNSKYELNIKFIVQGQPAGEAATGNIPAV